MVTLSFDNYTGFEFIKPRQFLFLIDFTLAKESNCISENGRYQLLLFLMWAALLLTFSLYILKFNSQGALAFCLNSLNFSLADQKPEGKKFCKYYVQRGLGLASEGTQDGNRLADITYKAPLVVCITRLVPQKGLHLISHAIKHIEELVSITLSESNMVK